MNREKIYHFVKMLVTTVLNLPKVKKHVGEKIRKARRHQEQKNNTNTNKGADLSANKIEEIRQLIDNKQQDLVREKKQLSHLKREKRPGIKKERHEQVWKINNLSAFIKKLYDDIHQLKTKPPSSTPPPSMESTFDNLLSRLYPHSIVLPIMAYFETNCPLLYLPEVIGFSFQTDGSTTMRYTFSISTRELFNFDHIKKAMICLSKQKKIKGRYAALEIHQVLNAFGVNASNSLLDPIGINIIPKVFKHLQDENKHLLILSAQEIKKLRQYGRKRYNILGLGHHTANIITLLFTLSFLIGLANNIADMSLKNKIAFVSKSYLLFHCIYFLMNQAVDHLSGIRIPEPQFLGRVKAIQSKHANNHSHTLKYDKIKSIICVNH